MPRFGVAGYPPAFDRTAFRRERTKICEWLRALGLDAFELQMTYGPRTMEARCRDYRKAAEDHGIKLSVHASYFIVFTSADPVKLKNSTETLKRTYELAHLLNADAVILHPGPLYGAEGEPQGILDRFVDHAGAALAAIGPSDSGLFVETAGKMGQLGSLDEILAISDQLPGVFPCIDFGHIHARTLGTLDTEEAIDAVFSRLASRGFFKTGNRVHFHYTPIHYGHRGEIGHKTIHDRYDSAPPPDPRKPKIGQAASGLYYPRFEPVARCLKKWQVDCTIISETKNSQEEGALALKAAYESCKLAAGKRTSVQSPKPPRRR